MEYARIKDNNNLTILMVSEDFFPAITGIGFHLQGIIPSLVQMGHKVHVLTTKRAGENALEEWKGATIHRLPSFEIQGYAQIFPVRSWIHKIIKNINPDIIHVHYLGLIVNILEKETNQNKIPHIYTFHMTEDVLCNANFLKPFRAHFRRKIRNYCNNIDHVISVSKNLIHDIRHRGITTPISYVSNPITLPFFPSNQQKSDTFTVIYAGRLSPEKNIPYLIKGFADFTKKVPNSKLLIAGQGILNESLHELVNELGISKQTEFLGFLSHKDLAHYYSTSHVFVLPSRVETQSIVAIEAMSYGLPILIADTVVSATELVDEGVNGYIIHHESTDDLSRRLFELYMNKEGQHKMGQAGLEKSKQYTPEIIAQNLVQIYQENLIQKTAS